MRMRAKIVAIGVLLICAMASTVRAQSAIAGVVRDNTGAVLPGVTVEASSPALIGGSRIVVTDNRGQYNVVELRPGLYTVTFDLTGFAKVVREQINLPASFTATVNADMRLATVEETITVSGQAPVVDVKGSAAQSVMDREQMDTIPTGRDPFAVGQLIAGVTTSSPDVGGTKGMQQPTLQVHGSDGNDGVYQQDGMTIQHVAFSGNQTGFYYNDGDMQEVVYRTAALPAENAYGGVQINMVPKEGGNSFHGAVFTTGATQGLQADNESQELYDRGLTPGGANKVKNVYDLNMSLGGPIRRDRLWFFGTFRRWGANSYVANTFNQDGSQAIDDNRLTDAAIRLTWQAAQNHKFNLGYNKGAKWRGHRRANLPSGTVFVDPISTVVQSNPRNYIAQAKWYGTVSNHLLLEAGAVVMPVDYNLSFQPETTAQDHAKLDLTTGLLYGAAPWDTTVTGTMQSYSGSVSYVTGSHNIKGGIQTRTGFLQQAFKINDDILLRFRSGEPDSVITYNTPVTQREDLKMDLGIYLQDSWTLGRLTLNPGVRFDYQNMGLPSQHGGGGIYQPTETTFGALPDLVVWKTVVPRFGMAWDVFGTGKTALKGGISQYVRQEGTSLISEANPNARSSDTRSWSDLNGDGNAQANELGPSTGFSGGATTRLDQNLKRPYQWEWSLLLEHQLRPRLAVSVGYYGRRFFDLYESKNLLVTPGDYTPVTITNPLDGSPLTVYNQDPATRSLQDSVISTFPDLYTRYHGVEFKANQRLTKGNLFAGFTIGQNKGTNVGDLNNPNNLINYIGNIGYDSTYQLRAGGSYVVPFDVQLSAALRSATGLPSQRIFRVGRAQVPDLTQVTQNVNVAPRGEYRLDRFDILDLRVSKIFRAGNGQFEIIADLYNALNSSAVTGEVTTLGSSLGRPSEVVSPRILRLGGQIRF
jgi:hypothetical protein